MKYFKMEVNEKSGFLYSINLIGNRSKNIYLNSKYFNCKL